jgi:hypothetical protein
MKSPEAAKVLMKAVEHGKGLGDLEDLGCETDCPEGCRTELDGDCEHGYDSAMLTAGLI